MKRLLKWSLAPAVLLLGLTLFGADRAEAARWRAYARSWYAPYVATYAYPYWTSYYPRYYWGPRAVRVPVYRSPVVYGPVYRYAPVIAYPAPCYGVWY